LKPTTDGSSRPPSAVTITLGEPPSITATTLLVVPKSMPTILDIVLPPFEKLMRAEDTPGAQENR
jgi:hypothetical protein